MAINVVVSSTPKTSLDIEVKSPKKNITVEEDDPCNIWGIKSLSSLEVINLWERCIGEVISP